MEGLLTLLLFAGGFYLMMRFGCGSHVHGGHGHESHTGKTSGKNIDPVCGMELEEDQGYGKMHEGRLFRFCSRDCLDKFEAEPGKYLKGDAS